MDNAIKLKAITGFIILMGLISLFLVIEFGIWR